MVLLPRLAASFGRRVQRALAGALVPAGSAVLLATCHAQAERAAALPAAIGAEASSPLDVSRARPDALASGVRAALAAGALGEAAALLEAASGADPEVRAWLRAEVAAASDDDAARRAALEEVVALGGALAPWARLDLAAATPDRADALLAPLDGLDWPGALEADLLRARTVPALEALLAAHPEAGTVRRALAERLAEHDDPAALLRALELWRALDARAPSRELERRIDAILARLPAADRPEAPLALRLARAEALAAQQRHEASEEAFAAVVRAASDAPEHHEIRCRAELGVGRARFRRRAREEAIATLDGMAGACTDVPDAAAWGRYFAAKSHANLDRRADAVAAWDTLADTFPSHRLADDARVEAARLLLRDGDGEGARARLEAAVAMPVPGDLRGEARFLLAWTARGQGDLAGALAALEASLAEGPGEEGEDLVGRAAYWRAAVLRELGRSAEADAALAALAAASPLSFYGQEARARLALLAPERLPELPSAEPALVPDAAPSAGLERALALCRVGEGSRAARELEHAGVFGDDATEATSWWGAALLAEAGAHHRAVELARRRLAGTLSLDTSLRARARIAYPRAYAGLIAGAAENEGIPSSLVFAIAREESSFEPSAVSVAHAYGMLQILPSTARPIAERLGLPSDVRSLARPDVSVRIGARYLSSLSRRYASNPSVVPAAYNAGQGAVDRWLSARRELPLDAWIEEIPFAETRRYTRRVLMSQGIYEWLETGALPVRSASLPRRG